MQGLAFAIRLSLMFVSFLLFFFFFQAEDGIRDPLVTGVQTCALPILRRAPAPAAWMAAPRTRASGGRAPRRRRSRRRARPVVARETASRPATSRCTLRRPLSPGRSAPGRAPGAAAFVPEPARPALRPP